MTAHAEFLRVAASDDLLAERVKRDFRNAPIPPAEKRLLEFVETLTLAPWELTRADAAELFTHGWTELELIQTVLGSAHFNYLNRMADGLGIRFEYASSLPEFELPDGTRPERMASPARSLVLGEGAFVPLHAAPTDCAAHEPIQLWRALGAPPALVEKLRAWRAFQFRATPLLDDEVRAGIALLVATRLHAHGAARRATDRLAALGADDRAIDGWPDGDLDTPLDRGLAEHARRLADEPWTVTAEHVDRLRELGLSDRDVVRLTAFVAWSSLELRAEFGLGVA